MFAKLLGNLWGLSCFRCWKFALLLFLLTCPFSTKSVHGLVRGWCWFTTCSTCEPAENQFAFPQLGVLRGATSLRHSIRQLRCCVCIHLGVNMEATTTRKSNNNNVWVCNCTAAASGFTVLHWDQKMADPICLSWSTGFEWMAMWDGYVSLCYELTLAGVISQLESSQIQKHIRLLAIFKSPLLSTTAVDRYVTKQKT